MSRDVRAYHLWVGDRYYAGVKYMSALVANTLRGTHTLIPAIFTDNSGWE